LIAGLLAGLAIIGLVLRTPMVRDFFAALATTGLVEVLIGERNPHDPASLVDQTALAVSSHPYFTMGLIVAAATVAALYRFDPTK
jgi:xanthosine utilization system XapX-like protein